VLSVAPAIALMARSRPNDLERFMNNQTLPQSAAVGACGAQFDQTAAIGRLSPDYLPRIVASTCVSVAAGSEPI